MTDSNITTSCKNLACRSRGVLSSVRPRCRPTVTLAALGFGLVTLLGACAGPDPVYYSLNSAPPTTTVPAGTKQVEIADEASDNSAAIGTLYFELQAIHVPERLNKTQIVTFGSRDTADVRDLQRWTAPFPDEFRDALSQQLQTRLHAVDLYQQNGVDALPRYRINIDVVQFDPLPDMLHARVSWTLRGSVSNTVFSGVTQVSLPADGSIQNTVEAGRAVVRQVAADIARKIIRSPA